MSLHSTRISLFALASALLLGLGLVMAPAAFAHDELTSSNPADGDELEQQPEWLELEFSGNIQEIGSEIQVMHEGSDVSAGEITVDGQTLQSALPDDLAAGEYSVVWRVVSEDGHPIDGEFTFTILDDGGSGGEVAEEGSEEDPLELGAGVVENPEPAEDRGELESGDAKNASSGMSTPMMLLLGVGALAIVVMVVLLLARKNKGLPGTEGGSGDSSDGSGSKGD